MRARVEQDEQGRRREVVETAPVSVQYEITEFGRTALTFLDELRKWSEGLPQETQADA